MANVSNSKIIRLYVLRPYGHGAEKYYNRKMVKYIDYFLEDLAYMLIEQGKEADLDKYLTAIKQKYA